MKFLIEPQNEKEI